MFIILITAWQSYILRGHQNALYLYLFGIYCVLYIANNTELNMAIFANVPYVYICDLRSVC